VGDVKYGYNQANQDGSIYLHCRSMSFLHPVQQTPVTITADAPNERMWNQMNALGE
jgi:23S rRNA pseudouridine1911/1915/1917 synthase